MRHLIVPATLILAASCFAAPATTSKPATQPAAPDHSTPDKTWTSLCNALKDNDLATFRAGFYNRNELSQMFIDAYSDATVASFDLAVAASILGKDGMEISKTLGTVYTDLVATGNDHKTETTPEAVCWIHVQKTPKGNIEEAIFFKLFKGQWLVDTVRTYNLDSDKGRDGAEQLVDTLPKRTAVIKQVSADIRSGKLTTIDEVRSRLAAAK